jgi:hypothetical protein
MWKQNDFCDVDSGFDYIFGVMSAIYGSRFTTHWQDVEPAMVRQVWKEQLGRFLTYKPSLDYAIAHLKGEFPPSAITFRELCNAGPNIPTKVLFAIEKQKTQSEIADGEKIAEQAKKKLAQLRKSFGGMT